MPDVICAGHVCLDIAPTILGSALEFDPGKLVEIGDATLSTGGCVPNTGIALHKLGVDVGLMGKIGDDLFGNAIREIARKVHGSLADGMIVLPGESTSYSIVLNLAGSDRMFLHCPGANDTFCADDVNYESLREAKIFHFGYPPLMARMYADGGRELAEMFRRAKETGVTTSLDMSLPDPNAPSGKACWLEILSRALPHVDIFAPSIDELGYVAANEERGLVDRAGRLAAIAGGRSYEPLANRMIGLGAKIMLIKAGEDGVFLHSARDLSDLGRGAPANLLVWAGHSSHAPAFEVDVASSTGAGDAAIAGFLMAILSGFPPDLAAVTASAVGATSCEGIDAHSSLTAWNDIGKRIQRGWPKRD